MPAAKARTLETGTKCSDGTTGVIRAVRFDNQTDTTGEDVTERFADIRLKADQSIVFALAPKERTIPAPPSVANLAAPSDLVAADGSAPADGATGAGTASTAPGASTTVVKIGANDTVAVGGTTTTPAGDRPPRRRRRPPRQPPPRRPRARRRADPMGVRRAIVLVGGEGTRLRPLTYTRPKPLLPVVGISIIERKLIHLAEHGIDEVVLSLGYQPDKFLAAFPDGEIAGCGCATPSSPLRSTPPAPSASPRPRPATSTPTRRSSSSTATSSPRSTCPPRSRSTSASGPRRPSR